MKLYQLKVTGGLATMEGAHTISSKRVFTKRKKAEEYQPEFIKLCLTPKDDKDIFYLDDKVGVDVSIHELELIKD
jgi:hypothetical protein